MGLNKMISGMPKKRLELFKNIVSVCVIVVIAYSAIVIAQLNNPLDFIKTSAFVNVTLSLILLSIIWKMLSGGKIHIPNQQNQHKPVKKQQPRKPIQNTKQTNKSVNVGSWRCPKCGNFNITDKCMKCGYQR